MKNIKLTIPSLLGLLASAFGSIATVLPVLHLPTAVTVPVAVIGAAVCAANEKLVQVVTPAAPAAQ